MPPVYWHTKEVDKLKWVILITRKFIDCKFALTCTCVHADYIARRHLCILLFALLHIKNEITESQCYTRENVTTNVTFVKPN